MKPATWALKLTQKLSRCTLAFQFRRSLTEVHPCCTGFTAAATRTETHLPGKSSDDLGDFAEMNVLLDGTEHLSQVLSQ